MALIDVVDCWGGHDAQSVGLKRIGGASLLEYEHRSSRWIGLTAIMHRFRAAVLFAIAHRLRVLPSSPLVIILTSHAHTHSHSYTHTSKFFQ
jgi:hypothetical protein